MYRQKRSTIIYRIGLILILIYFSPNICAQNNDTIKVENDKNLKDSIFVPISKIRNYELMTDSLNCSLRKLEIQYKNICTANSDLNKNFTELKIKYKNLDKEYSVLDSIQKNSDKKLVNTAINFLYIPYEAFSINEIAIPAFEAIHNNKLKEDYLIIGTLLKSYKTDLKDIFNFIEESEKTLQKSFANRDDAGNLLDKLSTMPFYLSYHNYQYWKDTYIGKIILNIYNQLNSFVGFDIDKKVDFSYIKSNIVSCLKTDENE